MTTIVLDGVPPGSSIPGGSTVVTGPVVDPDVVVVVNPPDASLGNITNNVPSGTVQLDRAEAERLADLRDVDLVALDDGSFLRYNESTQRWEAVNTISIGGSVPNLDGIDTDRIIGRISPGVGLSEELTPAQVTTMLLSGDPDNRLTSGTDGKLFNPELLVDPLAYYILAKA